MGVVKSFVNGNMIDNRGFLAMFVGYPKDHAEGTYLMINLKTRRVVIGRTVDWLNESYGENQKLKDNEICRVLPLK